MLLYTGCFLRAISNGLVHSQTYASTYVCNIKNGVHYTIINLWIWYSFCTILNVLQKPPELHFIFVFKFSSRKPTPRHPYRGTHPLLPSPCVYFQFQSTYMYASLSTRRPTRERTEIRTLTLQFWYRIFSEQMALMYSRALLIVTPPWKRLSWSSISFA